MRFLIEFKENENFAGCRFTLVYLTVYQILMDYLMPKFDSFV